MNKSAVNPVFVVALACLPILSITNLINEVVFLALLVGVVYIISASIVSIMEKITDRNLTFFVYMVIVAALTTALTYIYTIFPNSIFAKAGDKILYCSVSAGILGLNLIYHNSRHEISHYFFKIMVQVPCFLLLITLVAIVVEVFGVGTFWGISTGFPVLSYLTSMSGKFLVLALFTAFMNAYWLNISQKKEQYDLLVAKYKMKLNAERNEERVKVVNDSEVENFGVSELIDKSNSNVNKEGGQHE